jgi:hypothetical protein
MLTSFGVGQVLPLLLAGNLAASLPRLLALAAHRPVGSTDQWGDPSCHGHAHVVSETHLI